MRKKILVFASLALLLAGSAINGWAQLTPEEVDRLGKDLTPFGAIKAGNADGTIPEWTGGITTPPAGYKVGDHHPDPYADDKILFTITPANVDQYADKLSEGHKALLKTYPSYKMNVYPTHRSAAAPQVIYDKTKKLAAKANLLDDGNGVTGGVGGVPFPIPKNGYETIWNHLLRWRGYGVDMTYGQAPVTRGGDYNMAKFNEKFIYVWNHEGMTVEKMDNTYYYVRQHILAPSRIAGRVLLLQETLDQKKDTRRAWVYNPGQRRVRRAPQISFDNPRPGSDGLMVSDQVDLYNGSLERYNWKLVGRKEIYVPYNSYKLNSPKLKYKDILKPTHINQDHARYELHRVWVVDATLKEGTRHLYKRRTFYLDEDSWQIVAIDIYDNRDKLWRVSEGHSIIAYEVPVITTIAELHYDLQSSRYLAGRIYNEEKKAFNFNVKFDKKDYTTSSLRRAGKR